MPVLIQDCVSGNYLGPDGGWTHQCTKALKFEQMLRAWEAIDEHRLSGVRIVFEPQSNSDSGARALYDERKNSLGNVVGPNIRFGHGRRTVQLVCLATTLCAAIEIVEGAKEVKVLQGPVIFIAE